MIEKGTVGWKALLLSRTLVNKNLSHQIAYIALFAAFNVVMNALGSVPLGYIQFSLTLFSACLTGIIIGPLFGFVSSFVGDALGFFISPVGTNGFSPWVGISVGVASILAALIVNGIVLKMRGGLFLKLLGVCISVFLVCTVAINTTAGYFLWNSDGLNFWAFLGARLSLQVWNNVLNSVLLFLAVPALNRIKPLHMNIS